MAKALISGNILTWARERFSLSRGTLALAMKVKIETITDWEEGTISPTFRQAQSLANKLSIPLGYLFLKEPPRLEPQIADLRTIQSEHRSHFSPDFEEVLNDCLRKQNWYREQLQEEGIRNLKFIGRFSIKDEIQAVASNIRTELGLTAEFRNSCTNWEDFLVKFIEKVEGKGILVLRNGVVKNSTRRKLSLNEFRGFVLSDLLAPLIFINNNDSNAAKIFTLAHELAHLWIGESGVTNINPGIKTRLHQPAIEKFCNHVAAEILVPELAFINQWNDRAKLNENLTNLSKVFRVSPLVILIRAKTYSKIDSDTFYDTYPLLSARRELKESGSGNAFNTFPVRNSKKFTRTLLTSTLEGKTLHRDAANLLGVKIPTLHSLANHMEII